MWFPKLILSLVLHGVPWDGPFAVSLRRRKNGVWPVPIDVHRIDLGIVGRDYLVSALRHDENQFARRHRLVLLEQERFRGMKDIFTEYSKRPKGLFRSLVVGIEWRFARMIFGSFLINIFKENMTPVFFGHSLFS